MEDLIYLLATVRTLKQCETRQISGGGVVLTNFEEA